MSQTRFAELIGVSQPQVSRYEREEDTPNEPKVLERIARLGKRTVPQLLYGSTADVNEAFTIPVVSYIGAGERVMPIDAGQHEYAELPPDTQPDRRLRAMRVRGDSMRPLLSENWLIYYHQPTAPGVEPECFNGLCVIETADGEMYIKELLQGSAPHLFHLVSFNPSTPVMRDVPVMWATPVVAFVNPNAPRSNS